MRAQYGFDLLVVGAGILGLAHAYAAAKRGLKVAVLDRSVAARGASVRNFGFITVSGQEAGDCWQKARRSRDVWAEVAAAAKIPVLHEGLLVTARRPEAEAVIDAFLATEMADGCRRLTLAEARQITPALRDGITAVLHSPHELRVESRTAIPQLAAFLAETYAVDFFFGVEVRAIAPPQIMTTQSEFRAGAVVVCPGASRYTLFHDAIAQFGMTDCQLHMLRLQPERPLALGTAIMSDLGLARYLGYAALPEAAPLKARLDAEQAAHRAMGVHLIAVQSADGSLVVGDSHEYGRDPDDLRKADIDDLILSELDAVLDTGPRRVSEEWLGVYPSAADGWLKRASPDGATRLVVVSAGCGASTAFAIGEETVDDLFGRRLEA